MVLNHASLMSPDRHTALAWLKDLAIGMAQLQRIAQSSLRMRLPVHEIRILSDFSLFDAYIALKKSGAREESVFLMRLSTRYPLLSEVESDVRARFLGCEGRQIPLEDCEPLILCAIANWIAIGFPSDSIWDKDQLTVSFDELLPDESFQETSETIDNLARSTNTRTQYANAIVRRFLEYQEPSVVWAQRNEAFPNLFFGPDVEPPPEILGVAIRRLAELDRVRRRMARMLEDPPLPGPAK